MKSFKRIAVLATVFTLAVVLIAIPFIHPRHTNAQYGASTIPGFYTQAVNAFPVTTATGSAGTVTNTGTFVMQIDGGPVYCTGEQGSMSESNLTLAANTTFLIVYNCPQALVYAKTAVTAPGTSTTNPGVPSTLLYPISGLEVPLATVVCGASTCATITDNRPLASFPVAAVPIGKSTFANLPATFPDGGMLLCSSCTQPAAGSVSPCTTGAAVVLAVRIAGAWRCY